jgi:hypothetical protein
MGATSIAVLIICIGVIIARRPDSGHEPTRVASNVPLSSVTDPSRLDSIVPNGSANGSSSNSNSTQNPGGQKQESGSNANPPPGNGQPGPNQPSVPQTNDRSATPLEVIPEGRSGSRLPPADPNGDEADNPAQANVPTTQPSSTAPKTTLKTNGDPQPEPETAQTQPPPPAPDQGQYDIKVHAGSGGRIGSSGSQPVTGTSGGSAQMFTKIAQNDLLTGNYSAAVTHLEQAIKGGGDPVKLNHQLGIAYGNLGLNSNAATAYQHAIEACDSALQGGKGDPIALRRVKEACQSALASVKG